VLTVTKSISATGDSVGPQRVGFARTQEVKTKEGFSRDALLVIIYFYYYLLLVHITPSDFQRNGGFSASQIGRSIPATDFDDIDDKESSSSSIAYPDMFVILMYFPIYTVEKMERLIARNSSVNTDNLFSLIFNN